jgi:hypothetical protein
MLVHTRLPHAIQRRDFTPTNVELLPGVHEER